MPKDRGAEQGDSDPLSAAWFSTDRTACQNKSRREKLLWDAREESSARSGGAASPQTHGDGVETSKLISC